VRTGEERKLVTVLFADLVGSTAFAGDRDPERVRAQLERFYEAMREEIELTGGTVEKFAGDAVMAVFGAPAALEDHAERALHAGLAMQESLVALFGDELEMRIGVNTGEVVVGSAREGSSFVTGDAVNVCDRLQKAAEAGEVLAGERTADAVAGAFELGQPRVVEAKGKPDGVVGVPVLRAVRLARPRGVSGLRRAFVGRDTELELLRATYRRAASNAEPHLVTIVGEPGVGKSRLVRELQNVLATEQLPPVVRAGRCLPYGDGITYWPIGEIVREHFGLPEGAAPDEVARKLQGREILGLALGLDVALELHPLDAREGLHAAVVALVRELAADSAAVVVIEDLHWAEPDLLDLLERVASDVRAPVVVLATARPELLDHRPIWGSGKRNATVLWLDPLPAAEASQMLEEMVAAALPDDLRHAVVERAEGNPFFLEELVGELVDRGALVRAEDGWSLRAGQPDLLAIPDTIHAVLAARIDRLPPVEKNGLQAAAVVGRVFWRPLVLHLMSGEEPDFGLLEERDLITARGGSVLADDGEFAFKHALTREVAYGSIPKARRGRLHAALADWLERDIGLDERASLLAYHYSEAVKPEDADLVWGDARDELERVRGRGVYWLSRAGQLAQRRSEFDESVELLSRAVELCDDDHERALLWREIGLANALRFDGDAFWSGMQRALDGPLDDEERADVYSVLAFQTSNRSGMWGVQTVPELVNTWVDRALDLAAPDSDARARALIARVNMEPEGHAEEAALAGALAEASGDLVLRSFALQVRASVAQDAGRYAEAESLAEQRLALVPEIDDPDHLLDVYEASSPAFCMVGRVDEAREFAALHEKAAEPLSPHHRVHSFALLCEIEDAAGGWEAIEARSDDIVAAVEGNLETPCTRNARSLLVTAVAQLVAGREARALETRALELAQRGWSAGALASPGMRLGILRGDRREIERWLDLDVFRMYVYGPGVMTSRLDALAVIRARAQVEELAPAYLSPDLFVEPFALRALGIVRGDDELLERADRLFAQRGLEWHRSQTERLLAGLS
jgi:class 3 adenylate cyclase/tetratricopeptide (TPR) repeat protein